MTVASDALAGFTIGVTATRRAGEFTALLERRGARVVRAPAMRLVPLEDDRELLAATRECLAPPVDDVVVTTGVGFRGWNAAAEGWGLGGDLTATLASSRILARGPKARGAIRAAGLNDVWAPESESCEEIKEYLLGQDLYGRRIAVQLHGEPQTEFIAALRGAGAEVIEVPVYRWMPPRDVAPLRRLIAQTTGGGVDAVAFTSAPAVLALLAQARSDGLEDKVLATLRGPVVAACVGPVTASPLEERDVPTVRPERSRLGALARSIAGHLPSERVIRLVAAGNALELRGHAVVVDGSLRALPPAQMAVLKRLSVRPGHVVSRAELRAVLPGGRGSNGGSARGAGTRGKGGGNNTEHAVEMAVTRLRRALGAPAIVETVIKRGYRLSVS